MWHVRSSYLLHFGATGGVVPGRRGDVGVQASSRWRLASTRAYETPTSWHVERPRTTEHDDRACGSPDCHGVRFLTAYVVGV